jgi:large subunit ribosomal protein L21
MFAVIKTGGKQYKVAANDILKIEKLPSEAGDVVTFDQVLMVGDGADVTVGAPLVEGALVAGQLLETRKQKTIIVFKKERRHNYRRRNGHRQLLSTVRITEILTGGAAVTTQPDERIKARLAAANAAAAPADTVSEAAMAPRTTAAGEPAAAANAGTDAAPAASEDKPKATRTRTAKAASGEGEAKPAKKPAARKAAPKADKE